MTKLKVGVDARLLSESLTGIGRYCHEILKVLSRYEVDLFLYSARPIKHLIESDNNNVTVRTANCTSRSARMLWSQTLLPYWANKDELDVFWGTSHRLPTMLSKNIAQVVTIHDLVWQHAPQSMRKLSCLMDSLFMPRAITSADMIIAVSHSTAHDVAEAYPQVKDQIGVTHLGVTHLNTSHGFSNDLSVQSGHELIDISQPYILFVGTLEPRKNLKRLLKAYSLLATDIKKRFKFAIVGGKGWGDVDLARYISEYNIEQQCVVLGYVDSGQLGTLYKNAYCLAMPSLYEGFGLPIIEAHAHGVPVVTSTTSSMPEVASEGAVFVDPFDVRAITVGLNSLLGNESLRLHLSKKALENAAKFNWQCTAEKTFEVLKKAVERRQLKLRKT